ncbi:MAG: futalosine hydrolase [Prevotellaceae bacterium]|jgi:futalosine hydrolase|nr:futalosine hydrolase [Prevotellaceae bacterium]
MCKILVTAATLHELKFIDGADNVTVAATGVGIASTAYNLAKLLHDRYDFVLNIGIAGSFSDRLNIGDVTAVYSETFGDFGVSFPCGMTKEIGFSTCFEANIIPANMFPFTNGSLISGEAEKISRNLSVPLAKGVTNNTVSGENSLIKRMRDKFSPDIETMEGAAFFYVCLCENIPFVEIRSISNMVESRNKSGWDIPLAIKNLSEKVNLFIAAKSQEYD